MTSSSFADYIQRFRHGDISVLSELYQRTYNHVYFLIYGITQNHTDSQDILQDVYIQAFSKLDTLENPNAFLSWLGRIAVNTTINHVKKEHWQIVDIESEQLCETLCCEENLPQEAAEQTEVREVLLRLINLLPDAQRRAVLMFYYQQMTSAEIAAVENVDVSTITSRLSYARASLRKAVRMYESKHNTRLYAGAFATVLASAAASAYLSLLPPYAASVIFTAVLGSLGIGNTARYSSATVIDTGTNTVKSGFCDNKLSYLFDSLKIFIRSTLVISVKKPALMAIAAIFAMMFFISGIAISRLINAKAATLQTDTSATAAAQPYTDSGSVTAADLGELYMQLISGAHSINITGTLYADRTLNISDDTVISGSGTIARLNPETGEFFGDPILRITGGCSVTLGGITLDGSCRDESGEFVRSAQSLIYVAARSDLTLDGTRLHSNYSVSSDDSDGIGGAVAGYSCGTVTVTGATVIEDNLCSSYGGGVALLGGRLYMDGGIICGCRSKNNGGAISVGQNGSAVITGGVISNNSAVYTAEDSDQDKSDDFIARGGAIEIYGESRLEISGGEFSFNSTNGAGGVIKLEAGSEAAISGGSFIGNSCGSGSGGAISLGVGNRLDITGGEFISNSSPELGGAIRTQENATLNVSGAKFEKNTARNGGAIYCAKSVLTVSGGTVFSKNTADFGGALSDWYGSLYLYDAVLDSNSALKLGGALFEDNCEEVLIDGAELTSNYADTGGAVYIVDCAVEIKSRSFKSNSALSRGGLLMLSNAGARISGGVFTDNSTSSRSGTVFVSDTSSIVLPSDCTADFSGNTDPDVEYSVSIERANSDKSSVDERFSQFVQIKN